MHNPLKRPGIQDGAHSLTPRIVMTCVYRAIRTDAHRTDLFRLVSSIPTRDRVWSDEDMSHV